MDNFVILNVPYRDNKTARSLGAFWNRYKRAWCVNISKDLTPFHMWLPTGRFLQQILLKVEEENEKAKEAEKGRPESLRKFNIAKKQAAHILAVSKYMGISYEQAENVCSFIHMNWWGEIRGWGCGMYIVNAYATAKGITLDEVREGVRKIHVPGNFDTDMISACRDPKRCFLNGQAIRHKCKGGLEWWTGVFRDGRIFYMGVWYAGDDCIYEFAKAHYESLCLPQLSVYNYWDECECEIDGQWISFPPLSNE
jgi:hypothetical protein